MRTLFGNSKDPTPLAAHFIFTLSIIIATIALLSPFLIALAWAGVIAISTWPLYQRLYWLCNGHSSLAAGLLTLLFLFMLALPLTWLTMTLSNEAQTVVQFIWQFEQHGHPAPLWLAKIPHSGAYLSARWNEIFNHPHGIHAFLQKSHISIEHITDWTKTLALEVSHRSFMLFITLLSLFFCYRDGFVLKQQIDKVGQRCLGPRWTRYAENLPQTIRGTVNGSVLVGIGVGILLGASFAIADVKAPGLLGLLSAILSMVPFGAPLVFCSVSLGILLSGHAWVASMLLGWGLFVLFLADHIIRPMLIGESTRLSFLAVFISILGGIATLGLIGLFIGPAIIALFLTLWQEPQQ